MIAAILSGPSYGAPNHDETSIEVFNHIGEVVDALFERYASNGRTRCIVNTLDGQAEAVLFPTFGEGCQFTCFEVPLAPAPHPIKRFPEELVMEVLTAVHGGHWDWDVELVRGTHSDDLLMAHVEKAGVS